ncbi:MAG: hypothetical protein OQK12_09700 [Motiliproteus sp.]|nr:hypothetical protein [Motiliproteus sp.]MCW9053442.1 hypothetical protein [Motiliproteus sp.]
MNTAGLSLDNIPSFNVPMGFFLIAPWFGILAATSLLFYPDALTSRWNPALLTFVHLLTLGFAAMVMLGGMIQVLPVVSNRSVPATDYVAPWIKGFLCLGCIFLAGGFICTEPFMFGTAIVLLGAVFILFLGFVGAALVGAGRGGSTLLCLRLAALSLLSTISLGILQLSTYLDLEWIDYLTKHTDNHMMLGLLGWALLLIMGVSYQVIPMFHVAPSFPKWLTTIVPTTLFVALIAAVFSNEQLYPWLLYLVLACVFLYGASALRVLRQRKRKLVDYTVRFWQFALGNLLALCGLYLISSSGMDIGISDSRMELLLGFGFGLGFVVSVMLGMLQKIVPFLIYLHLQRACIEDVNAFMSLPNMKDIIPTSRSKWQYRLHIATVVMFYLCLLVPDLQHYLIVTASLIMAANFGWLLRSLLIANGIYNSKLPRKVLSTAS